MTETPVMPCAASVAQVPVSTGVASSTFSSTRTTAGLPCTMTRSFTEPTCTPMKNTGPPSIRPLTSESIMT